MSAENINVVYADATDGIGMVPAFVVDKNTYVKNRTFFTYEQPYEKA